LIFFWGTEQLPMSQTCDVDALTFYDLIILTLPSSILDTMSLSRIVTLLLASSSSAFVVVPQPRRAAVLYGGHLSEIDEMCVENVAAYCLNNDLSVAECDLDEMEALGNTLKNQREYHLGHVQKIHSLLPQLQEHDDGSGSVKRDTVIRRRHLSEEDEVSVENAAAYCLENDLGVECNVDEYAALFNTLQEQRDYHLEEVQTINDLLSKLGMS
jgi:hypothetical protein